MRLFLLTILMCLLVASEASGQRYITGHWLPPSKYDKEFDGRLVIERITSAQMKINCPDLPMEIACSGHVTAWKICVIYILEDYELNMRGYRYDLILRHEIGHCNGWGNDHAEAVFWPPPPRDSAIIRPFNLR